MPHFVNATRNLVVCIVVVLGVASLVMAQNLPSAAEGLVEVLVSVPVRDGVVQEGVLSLRQGTTAPTILAVLLPGSPSVVRPVVQGGAMVNSRLNGNFLVRARRHLADDSIATLLVDCISDSGDTCASPYQASPERQKHVQLLIDQARTLQPTVQKVWLVGTSLGTISSAFMAMYGGQAYAGALHTASITEPLARNSYRELHKFDYSKAGIPQAFVHHRDDPCSLTTYSGAQAIASQFKLPLVTVTGGSGFTGNPCQAYTQHGFRGFESEVMRFMAGQMKSGILVDAQL
jgi:predicted alpha/beta hydrolase family esterase